MTIAVLGMGNGGTAMAADLTLKGHRVAAYSTDAEKVGAITRNGGIDVSGVLGDRHVPIATVTGDLEAAVRDAQLVALPVPGMLQEQYLARVLPLLGPGQALWLCPGSAGSLVAAAMGVPAARPLLIETLSLPYAARRTGPASVGVTAVLRVRGAAFPAARNSEALALLNRCYEVPPAANVLETALMNVNFIIHPLPTLLNWGWIESRERAFSLYGEGMTPGVLELLRALDRERTAVCAAAGVATLGIDEIYAELGVRPLYRESMGLGRAERYEDRFVTEDVPIGLVSLASVGAAFGLDLPIARSVIDLASALYRRDFRAEGRSLERLGLAGMDGGRLRQYLESGTRAAAPGGAAS